MMTDIQALVTGIIAGIFIQPDQMIRCQVDIKSDNDGNYLPEIGLIMKNGTKLVIRVEEPT